MLRNWRAGKNRSVSHQPETLTLKACFTLRSRDAAGRREAPVSGKWVRQAGCLTQVLPAPLSGNRRECLDAETVMGAVFVHKTPWGCTKSGGMTLLWARRDCATWGNVIKPRPGVAWKPSYLPILCFDIHSSAQNQGV